MVSQFNQQFFKMGCCSKQNILIVTRWLKIRQVDTFRLQCILVFLTKCTIDRIKKQLVNYFTCTRLPSTVN
jgi:hypothetical protein